MNVTPIKTAEKPCRLRQGPDRAAMLTVWTRTADGTSASRTHLLRPVAVVRQAGSNWVRRNRAA